MPCCITCWDDLYLETSLFTSVELKNNEAMEKLEVGKLKQNIFA